MIDWNKPLREKGSKRVVTRLSYDEKLSEKPYIATFKNGETYAFTPNGRFSRSKECGLDLENFEPEESMSQENNPGYYVVTQYGRLHNTLADARKEQAATPGKSCIIDLATMQIVNPTVKRVGWGQSPSAYVMFGKRWLGSERYTDEEEARRIFGEDAQLCRVEW